MDATIEEIETLARSCRRVRILEELRKERALTRDELKERIDGARTTIQRNLDTLVKHGWVQYIDREYRITQTGELISDKFRELVDVVEVTQQLAPFLDFLETGGMELFGDEVLPQFD